MRKKVFTKLSNLLALLLVLFLTVSCDEKKEVIIEDLSSFGQNFNRGCGDFVVYAFSPDKRYALQIRSNERESLTENDVSIDLKNSTTVKVTLMDHRDLSKRELSREIYCTDIIINGGPSITEWEISEGNMTFNKSSDENSGNEGHYDISTEIKLKILVEATKLFQPFLQLQQDLLILF